MNTNLKRINHLLIGGVIILQPFIVMFQTMVVRDVQLFGLSIFEGFNIITLFVSLCLTVYTHLDKRIFLKYIPYVIILGIYFLLHGYNIYQFNNVIYPTQQPNFLVETYYIVRTFIVPLLLLFNIYYSGMKKEQIVTILEIFIGIVTVVMVLTNIFKVAVRNYPGDTFLATLNIFDWFTFDNVSRYSYYDLTTKGWFLSGNQMSAILFMTFSVVVYRAYKARDWYHYVLVILQILSMYMLGTKTANVGCLLIMGMFIVFWMIFKVLKHKEKGIVAFLVISVCFLMFFQFTPIGYKTKYENSMVDSGSSETAATMLESAMIVQSDGNSVLDYKKLREDSMIIKQLNPDELTEAEKVFVKEYMAEFCSFFGIDPFIIEHYDDLEHSDFWTRYIQESPNNNYRVLKTMILEDIYDKNDNPLDKYLGMGYTLNYIYTETDYTYQFYNYGIIGGVLLIGPYIWGVLYVIYQGLRHFKEMFTLECAMYYVAPLLGLCVAKFSGHVLERTLPLLILATVLGIVLIHTRDCICND